MTIANPIRLIEVKLRFGRFNFYSKVFLQTITNICFYNESKILLNINAELNFGNFNVTNR